MHPLLIGFGLGAGVGAQIGPMSLFLIRNTLRSGLAVGLAIGAGIALVDWFYAAAGTAGVAPLLTFGPLRLRPRWHRRGGAGLARPPHPLERLADPRRR